MTTSSLVFPRIELLRDVADDLEGLLAADGGNRDPAVEPGLEEAVSVLRNFLLPRLADRSSPFNVVFAGPTGSGKSTLINSVVRRKVSKAGPIRPTTTQPLVYTHRGNARARGLGRVRTEVATGDARILRFLSLIDTPDIDSTSTENHRKALDVIASADLVVFVASALRYADLVPWEVLRSVSARGVPVIHVLNRVTPENVGSVVDFRRRLEAEGMTRDVITVTEHRIDSGMLPLSTVQHLRTRILDMVANLDRGRAMEEALESVRLGLSEIAYSLNSRLVGRDGAAERAGGGLPAFDDFDRSALVARWRAEMKSAGGLASRLVGGERRLGALAALGGEIQEEMVTLIERDLRLIANGSGRVVIDLTDETGISVHLEEVDSEIARWFESLVTDRPSGTLGAAALRKRVAVAIDEFETVTGRSSRERSEDGENGLNAAIAKIYSGVSRDAAAASHSEALDVVQRARARMRSETPLVDA